MNAAAGKAREPVHDLDIQEWVHDKYGFVPHPFWINHCRELYLSSPQQIRAAWHECPAAIRPIIREAFSHFGLLLTSSGCNTAT